MRPSLLAAAAIGLLVVAGRAVADDELLELRPHWKKGEKRQYEKVKARETSGGPGGSQSMTARSDL